MLPGMKDDVAPFVAWAVAVVVELVDKTRSGPLETAILGNENDGFETATTLMAVGLVTIGIVSTVVSAGGVVGVGSLCITGCVGWIAVCFGPVGVLGGVGAGFDTIGAGFGAG